MFQKMSKEVRIAEQQYDEIQQSLNHIITILKQLKIWYSCNPKSRRTIFLNIISACNEKVEEGFLDANLPTQFILELELVQFFFNNLKNWLKEWVSFIPLSIS